MTVPVPALMSQLTSDGDYSLQNSSADKDVLKPTGRCRLVTRSVFLDTQHLIECSSQQKEFRNRQLRLSVAPAWREA